LSGHCLQQPWKQEELGADRVPGGNAVGKDECIPPIRNRTAAGYPERVRVAAMKFRLAETLGGTAKPGWSPRKGRRLSPFLGASCSQYGRSAVSSFNLESAVSCLAGASGMCSCEPRRKHYGSHSWTDPRAGDRSWLIGVYLGRDPETKRYISQSNDSESHAGTASLPDQSERDLGRDLERAVRFAERE
jgi:hypothetical protein